MIEIETKIDEYRTAFESFLRESSDNKKLNDDIMKVRAHHDNEIKQFTKQQVKKAVLEALEKETLDAHGEGQLFKHRSGKFSCVAARQYFKTQVKPRYTK